MSAPASPEDAKKPPLLEILLAVGSLLGLVMGVIGLDIDRTFRAVGAVLMLAALGSGIAAIFATRAKRVALLASATLLAAAVGVLAFAPPPAPAPAPTPTPSATPPLVVTATEVLSPGKDRPGTLDITLRNPTGGTVGLSKATVTVDGFARLAACVYGSNTQISGSYDLQLPDDPAPGTTLTKVLHQQLDAGATDRFTLGFAAPTRPANGKDPEDLAVYLYRLRVAVAVDNGTSVDLGTFVLETRNPLGSDVTHYLPGKLPATDADARASSLCGDDAACRAQVVACWNANRDAIGRLSAGHPGMSETMTRATTALGLG